MRGLLTGKTRAQNRRTDPRLWERLRALARGHGEPDVRFYLPERHTIAFWVDWELISRDWIKPGFRPARVPRHAAEASWHDPQVSITRRGLAALARENAKGKK